MNKFSLIINADDFGRSKDINFAIMSAMDLNLCKDTTLLVNFENSVHAARLAIGNNRKNNVGIHFNLTEGIPLTKDIKKESRFCNTDGFFHYKKSKRIIYLTTSEKKAINDELTSQIHLCRSLGLPISHADSHNHFHEEPGILFLLMDIIKRENIPFLRISKNIGKSSFLNQGYRNIYNLILSLNNLTASNYFGSISDYYESKKYLKSNSIIEIMIHPGSLKKNQIFDSYSKENLSMQLPKIITNNTLISYNQI